MLNAMLSRISYGLEIHSWYRHISKRIQVMVRRNANVLFGIALTSGASGQVR